MISGVTKQIGGSSETFRMTSRAMMALESHFETGIVEVLQGLKNGYRIGNVAVIIAECSDNGKGQDTAFAQSVIDEIGLTAAGNLIGEIAEAAFPEASEKNVKRAGRSK